MQLKKILVFFTIILLLFSFSGCNFDEILKNVIKQTGENISTDSDLKAPDGSPDWCGYSNADKIVKKYLNGDASASYRISELLGISAFKDNSYGAAKVESWIYNNVDGSHGEYYATVYFNENGSDVWVRVDPYISVGTEFHYIDGKLTEEIPIEE